MTSVNNFFIKLSKRASVAAIRHGLTMMIPFMVLGAFAIFINNLPVPAYQNAMHRFFGENWKIIGAYVYQSTFAIMAVVMNLFIAYSLINECAARKKTDINPVIGAAVSLSCLFALVNISGGGIPLEAVGSYGIFIAMAAALISSHLFIWLHKLNSLRLKLYSNAAETFFSRLMKSFFPAVITVCAFTLVRIGINAAGIADVHAFMYDGLGRLFENISSEFAKSILYVSFKQILWFFGIHGGNALDSVGQGVYVAALEANQLLVESGLPPKHIFTKQFFDVFIYMGGAGTTLSLIIALLIGTKRSSTKQVAKMGLLPGLINVNEIIIFAVPVVFNFYLIIPFVLIPIVLLFTSYAAMTLGLVPYTAAAVDWTTPVIIGGYAATGSVSGAVLQVFNLTAAVFMYLPFVRMYEKSLAHENAKTFQSLVDRVFEINEQKANRLIDKQDAEGVLARNLANDLKRDFELNKLFLHHQPQFNADNSILGAEALIRWKHDELGFIPPPLLIMLAEESVMIDELGDWIFKTAAEGLKTAISEGFERVIVSVNITPKQLDNIHMARRYRQITDEAGVPPGSIEIEITEQAALGGEHRLNVIKELQAFGFGIAMDDFGMGHSSLMYLKELNLNTIKFDGSLIREISTNPACREIISSIVHLSKSMNIRTIAEYVETHEQGALLRDLGCHSYQGYLYSPAVPLSEVIDYFKMVKNKNNTEEKEVKHG